MDYNYVGISGGIFQVAASMVNTLWLKQDGHHFAVDIFIFILSRMIIVVFWEW